MLIEPLEGFVCGTLLKTTGSVQSFVFSRRELKSFEHVLDSAVVGTNNWVVVEDVFFRCSVQEGDMLASWGCKERELRYKSLFEDGQFR